MNILVEISGEAFEIKTTSTEHGDLRTYYVAKKPKRMIIVCRNGLTLESVYGKVVDANVGKDSGYPGFVHQEYEGKPNTKVTIRKVVNEQHELKLRDILTKAYHE